MSFSQEREKDTISMQTFLMWETKDILEILYYHFNLMPILILIQQWFPQFYGFQFLIIVYNWLIIVDNWHQCKLQVNISIPYLQFSLKIPGWIINNGNTLDSRNYNLYNICAHCQLRGKSIPNEHRTFNLLRPGRE